MTEWSSQKMSVRGHGMIDRWTKEEMHARSQSAVGCKQTHMLIMDRHDFHTSTKIPSKQEFFNVLLKNTIKYWKMRRKCWRVFRVSMALFCFIDNEPVWFLRPLRTLEWIFTRQDVVQIRQREWFKRNLLAFVCLLAMYSLYRFYILYYELSPVYFI